MGPWIEIYDSEQVQWLLRQRVAGLSAAIGAAASIAVFVMSMAGLNVVPYNELLVLVAIAAVGVGVGVAMRLVALRSRVWCIKMSPHMIMGYNHLRKATTFAWSDVDHVAVSDETISVVSSNRVMIEIPTAFADFTHVAHRILDLAELHRRPIFLKGQPITDIDLYHLMPELRTLFAPRQVAAF